MNEIVKALEKFLTRDLLYVLGGGSVLISCAYFLGIPLVKDIPAAWVIFGAGIAYVIGYAVQEAMSFTPILTISHFKPNKLIYKLYELFVKQPLELPKTNTNLTGFLYLYPISHERQIAQIERTITLKHVGATMGSSWLVSSAFLSLKAFEIAKSNDIFIAASVFFLSVVLILMAWVKGAQQMHMLALLEKNQNEKET